jgi:class 3 adenylate cyclase/transcriptional regulator with XRE-family HTH domain
MASSQLGTDDTPFGDMLRRLRRAAGLTQEELGERAGLSARGLSDLERGVNRTPRRETVRALADALGLSPDERAALERARRRPPTRMAPAEHSPVPTTVAPMTDLPTRAPGARAVDVDGEVQTSGAERSAAPGAYHAPSPVAPPVQTFLFVDLRDFSPFTLEHGDAAAARLVGRHVALIREVTVQGGGQVAELTGDGALCIFRSPRDALNAAVKLQARFAAEMQADPALSLRSGIGLDAGEAVPVEGGFRGAALNLAARLCARAAPGEILATDALIHLARKVDGLEYVDRGLATVKGFAAPVHVLQVVPTPAPAPLGQPVAPAGDPMAPPTGASPTAAQPALPALPIGGFLGARPEHQLVARERELGG